MKVVAHIVLRPIAAPLRVSMEMYVVHSICSYLPHEIINGALIHDAKMLPLCLRLSPAIQFGFPISYNLVAC